MMNFLRSRKTFAFLVIACFLTTTLAIGGLISTSLSLRNDTEPYSCYSKSSGTDLCSLRKSYLRLSVTSALTGVLLVTFRKDLIHG